MGENHDEPACVVELRDLRRSIQDHMTDTKNHRERLEISLRECIENVGSLSEQVIAACSAQQKSGDGHIDEGQTEIFSSREDKYKKMKMEIGNNWDALASSIQTASARKNVDFPESVDDALYDLRTEGSADACMEKLFDNHPIALPNVISAIEMINTVKKHLDKELLEFGQQAASSRSHQAFIRKEEYLKSLQEQKALILKREYQKRLSAIDEQHAEWQKKTLSERQKVVESYLQSCTTMQDEFHRIAEACSIDSNVKSVLRVLKKKIACLRISLTAEMQHIEKKKRDRLHSVLAEKYVGPRSYRYAEETFPHFWSEFDEMAENIYDLKRAGKTLTRNLENISVAIRKEYDKRIDIITNSVSSKEDIEIVTHLDILPA